MTYNLQMSSEKKGSLRGVAFAAVVFSTVAVSACLITFPLVFHYVQTLQATVQVIPPLPFPLITLLYRARWNTVNRDPETCGRRWSKLLQKDLTTHSIF